jgi:hypothetical protein
VSLQYLRISIDLSVQKMVCVYKRKVVDKYGQDTEESSFQIHEEKDKPLFSVSIG